MNRCRAGRAGRPVLFGQISELKGGLTCLHRRGLTLVRPHPAATTFAVAAATATTNARSVPRQRLAKKGQSLFGTKCWNHLLRHNTCCISLLIRCPPSDTPFRCPLCQAVLSSCQLDGMVGWYKSPNRMIPDTRVPHPTCPSRRDVTASSGCIGHSRVVPHLGLSH